MARKQKPIADTVMTLPSGLTISVDKDRLLQMREEEIASLKRANTRVRSQLAALQRVRHDEEEQRRRKAK